MKRVVGMDIHRTFAEVVFWEEGRLRCHGRVDTTRSGLEGFARGLTKDDEVVVEATGNAMAVVRVLSPYVARVIIANPLQVRAIAHAHVKTDDHIAQACHAPPIDVGMPSATSSGTRFAASPMICSARITA